MTSESTAEIAAVPAPRRPTFERRASLSLRALAVFAVVATVFLIGNGSPPMAPIFLVPAAAAFAVTAWFVGTAIDRGRPWAVAVAPALLAILILSGVIDFLAGVDRHTLQIPVGLLLAIWSFAAPRAGVPDYTDRPALRVAVLATFTAASFALSLGPTVLGPGDPFDARPADIAVSLDVGCTSGGPVPTTVPVHFTWLWQRGAPFSSGVDGIAIAWRGRAAADDDTELFVARDSPNLPDGVWMGGGEQSGADADEYVAQLGAGLTFGVTDPPRQYDGGAINIELIRSPNEPATDASLLVSAMYSYRGRWHVIAKPMQDLCTW
jgi:hypothetical protein